MRLRAAPPLHVRFTTPCHCQAKPVGPMLFDTPHSGIDAQPMLSSEYLFQNGLE